LPHHPARHYVDQHGHAGPSGVGDPLAGALHRNPDTEPGQAAGGSRCPEPTQTDHGRTETTQTTRAGSLLHLRPHSRPSTPTGAEPADAEPPGAVIPLPRQPAGGASVAGPARAGSGASGGGWQVTRVETAPMSGEEFTAAVNALAALITEWNQRSTGSSEKTREAA